MYAGMFEDKRVNLIISPGLEHASDLHYACGLQSVLNPGPVRGSTADLCHVCGRQRRATPDFSVPNSRKPY